MAKSKLEISKTGTKRWYNENGSYHREDGPAVEYLDGQKFWYIHGRLHRMDGPAVELVNESKQWWYHDQYINCHSQEEFERIISLFIFE